MLISLLSIQKLWEWFSHVSNVLRIRCLTPVTILIFLVISSSSRTPSSGAQDVAMLLMLCLAFLFYLYVLVGIIRTIAFFARAEWSDIVSCCTWTQWAEVLLRGFWEVDGWVCFCWFSFNLHATCSFSGSWEEANTIKVLVEIAV